jgi:hypothetical protein
MASLNCMITLQSCFVYCGTHTEPIPIIRYSSSFSVSKEHLMRPTMSIYRVCNHIITMILDHTVATTSLDTIIANVFPLLALMMTLPVMPRKDHLWKLSVLQRVHHSNLFIYLRNSLPQRIIATFIFLLSTATFLCEDVSVFQLI